MTFNEYGDIYPTHLYFDLTDFLSNRNIPYKAIFVRML